MKYIIYENELYHHGIKGQKWGIRRWQNEDGSLTEAGRRHYDVKEARIAAKVQRAEHRAEIKKAKIQNKMSQRAEKAYAKEYKKNLKREDHLQKLENERMKLELKKMKQDIAYQRGVKFGQNFMPKFAAALGNSFGNAAGNAMGGLVDAQRWSENKTKRISAEAAKIAAKNGLMDAKLRKAKFDEGYDDRSLSVKEKEAKTNDYRSQTERMTADNDRIRVLEEREKGIFNRSDLGVKIAEEKRAIEAEKNKIESTKATADLTRARYETSEKGHALNMTKAEANKISAEAKSKGAEAGIINAKAERVSALGQYKKDKADAEATLSKARSDEAMATAKANHYYDELKSKEKLAFYKSETEKSKASNEAHVKKAEVERLREKDKLDYYLNAAKEHNRAAIEQHKRVQATVDKANKEYFSTIQKYNDNLHRENMFKIDLDSVKETRSRLTSELPRARQILSSPTASPAQKEEARSVINSIAQFNVRNESTSVPIIEITSMMPSDYRRNGRYI